MFWVIFSLKQHQENGKNDRGVSRALRDWFWSFWKNFVCLKNNKSFLTGKSFILTVLLGVAFIGSFEITLGSRNFWPEQASSSTTLFSPFVFNLKPFFEKRSYSFNFGKTDSAVWIWKCFTILAITSLVKGRPPGCATSYAGVFGLSLS